METVLLLIKCKQNINLIELNINVKRKLRLPLLFKKIFIEKHIVIKKYSIFALAKSNLLFSGCSVARLSRRVWDAEVAGSNPATPTF